MCERERTQRPKPRRRTLRRGWRRVTGLVLLLAAVTALQAAADRAGQVHHFEQPCRTCHQIQPDGSVGAFIGDINASCAQRGCHDYDAALSHRLDAPAPVRARAGLPTAADGTMTCLTCHDEVNRDTAPGERAFLRMANDGSLCAACHLGQGGTTRQRSHWQFSTRAHLPTRPRAPGRGPDHAARGGAIDEVSRNCLSCHDDISATITTGHEGARQRRQRAGSMKDHPIGTDYAATVLRSLGEYQPSSRLEPGIELFDGRVGCGSCHNLYADTASHLVASQRRGELCRKCHNKGR